MDDDDGNKKKILGYDCFQLGKFKNKDYFINYERDDSKNESGFLINKKIDSSVLDLMGEDNETLNKKRKKQYYWVFLIYYLI